MLLACALGAFAQDGHQWPRDSVSGKVEYKGSLPWPAGVVTEAQRRDLVRHWYLTKLTDMKPEDVANSIAYHGVTYDGLPKGARLEYITYVNDKEYFSLRYEVELTLTSAGLAYQLSNFGYGYFSVDVSNSDDLEDLLTLFPTGRPELAVFQKRLVAALAGW
ncbi:MAG: hypothetical protein ACRYFZ_12435 [Janthinobacterium lividum]